MPVALVTGAGRGIGAACATALAARGWDVGLTYAADRDACERTAGEVRALGARAAVLQAEARAPGAMDEAVAACERDLGPLDALVANAGTTRDGLAVRMDADTWSLPLEVNLHGTAAALRAAAAGMCARGAGAIVALTSVVGTHGNAGQANYAASKAALTGLVRTLARELGPHGVRVNAVAPGFIQTRLTDVLDPARQRALLERTALGRFGAAADVGGPVCYLCSARSSFVTGTVLDVDGGLAL